MPSSDLILAQGARWALGLSWLTFLRKPPVKDIESIVKTTGAHHVALRDAGAYQIGMYRGESKLGIKGKAYALGSAVAPAHATPWRGVFQIDETTWWYIAVRDNFAITIDGDVVGDLDTIRKIKTSHDYFDDWDEVEGTLRDIEEILATQGVPKIALVRANAKPAFILSVASIALLLVAVAAYGGFLYAKNQQLKAVQKRAALAAIRDASIKKPVAAVKPKPADVQMPKPLDMLMACWGAMSDLPLEDRGWLLRRAQCRLGSVTLEWTKTADADPALMADLHGFLGADGGSLTTSAPLAPVASGVRPAANVGASLEALKSLAQDAGMDLNAGNNQASQALNSQAPFTLTGSAEPDAIAPGLSGIDGLSIEGVAWDASTGWTYTGVVL